MVFTMDPGTLSLFPGLSADELSLFGTSTPYLFYYQNALTNYNDGSEYWSSFYPAIYIINSAIAGLATATDLTPAVQKQLQGEVRFMRAFCYFYLTNLYGDMPLVTGTDYSTNRLLPRSPQAQIWEQIIADLKQAESLLNSNYLDGTLLNTTSERVRPTSWAASSLLARAYLYQGKWDSAVTEANKVITQSTLYSLDSLNGVFLRNSGEAIWQLQPVNFGQNTSDAVLFILPSSGPDGYGYPVYLNPDLVNSFESGDLRRTNWVDSVVVGSTIYYYPFKYKVNSFDAPTTEYTMMLRLGEQYLIRAEAEANLGDIADAQMDLNAIRSRAGLSATSAVTAGDLQKAILNERRVELFTEWGHRWLDLKRTGAVDSVMNTSTPKKGGTWLDYKQWYPIPITELQEDPNLVQNSGY
jgi:starch-binding outer membrane protein, SusD/RagB family